MKTAEQVTIEALTDRLRALDAENQLNLQRWREASGRYTDLRNKMLEGQPSVPFDLESWQHEAATWEAKNFGEQPEYRRMYGVVEELGELCHAKLKLEQKIRLSEDHEAKAKDAVGDLVVFLANFCSFNGWSLAEIIKTTWAEVSQRDWQANRDTGIAVDQQQKVVTRVVVCTDPRTYDFVSVHPTEYDQNPLAPYSVSGHVLLVSATLSQGSRLAAQHRLLGLRVKEVLIAHDVPQDEDTNAWINTHVISRLVADGTVGDQRPSPSLPIDRIVVCPDLATVELADPQPEGFLIVSVQDDESRAAAAIRLAGLRVSAIEIGGNVSLDDFTTGWINSNVMSRLKPGGRLIDRRRC